LGKLEAEQRERIAAAESQLSQAQAVTQQLAAEQIRLQKEAKELQREQAQLRSQAAEDMRQMVESEARQRAAERRNTSRNSSLFVTGPKLRLSSGPRMSSTSRPESKLCEKLKRNNSNESLKPRLKLHG